MRKIEQWRLKLDLMDEEVESIVEKNARNVRLDEEEVLRQQRKAQAFQGNRRGKSTSRLPAISSHCNP